MNNYFPHDSNARNSDKLLPVRMKYGAEGYGIYFMLLERLREEADYTSIKDYNMLAFDLRVDSGKLKSIIEDFGLFAFTDDGECFYSDSFKKRMEIKDAKSKKLSEAGRQGAEKRWNKSNQEGKPKGSHSHPIANAIENDSKKRKEKETKGKKSKVNKKESTKEKSVVQLSSEKDFLENPLGDKKTAELIAYYSKNVSLATPVNMTNLAYDLKDFNGDLDLLKEAINICSNNVKTYAYFAGILKQWRANGINTHADFLKKVNKKSKQKNKRDSEPPLNDYSGLF